MSDAIGRAVLDLVLEACFLAVVCYGAWRWLGPAYYAAMVGISGTMLLKTGVDHAYAITEARRSPRPGLHWRAPSSWRGPNGRR